MTFEIRTGSWFTPLPDDHVRVGVSRGTPRGQVAGYRRYPAFAPGAWFKSASPAEYLRLYREQLDALDPRKVLDDLSRIAAGRMPVLTCYESATKIAAGETFCHRHIAAQWLSDRVGVTWREVGAPDGFEPFGLFVKEGLPPPRWTA
jgi:hypothetical protein